MVGTRVYVGGLSHHVSERDLEKFFRDYGRLRNVIIKNGFGFVEFDDYRDADDAVYELNGKNFMGERILVEFARGSKSSSGSGGSNRCYQQGSFSRAKAPWMEKYGLPTRTNYRLIVENLSTRVSWQDLKDFMRQAGDVTYADAHKSRRNEGVVEFSTHADKRNAILKLDGKDLQGRRIRLIDDSKHKRRSGSRSRSWSRSRSRSRGHRRRSLSSSSSYSRSSSKSMSRSPSKKKSRSRSLSNERSQSRSVSKVKLRSPSREISRSTSPSSRNARSKSKSSSKSRSRSKSRTPDSRTSKSKSKSITPDSRMSKSLSRSKSRSLSHSSSCSHSRSRSRSPSRTRCPRRTMGENEKEGSESPSIMQNGHTSDDENVY